MNKTSPVEPESGLVEDAYKIIRKWNFPFTGKLDFGSSVIAVVGSSGKGKTSLVQFLAGGVNNSNLLAIEDPPGSGQFVIGDKNGQIGDNGGSKYIYPNLVTSVIQKRLIFYDSPSFDKISTPPQAMATAYFNKVVMDKFDVITFVICVDFETATGSHGPEAFLREIKETAKFFKLNSALPYKNAFLLAVTKVPAHTESKYTTEIVPSDEEVTGMVANVMTTAYEILEHENDETEEEMRAVQNAGVILHGLMAAENGSFPKILLFRRPQESGELMQTRYMIINRQALRDAIQGSKSGGVAIPYHVYTDLSPEMLHQMEVSGAHLNVTINKVLMETETKMMDAILRRIERSVDWKRTGVELEALRRVLEDFAQKELKYDEKLTAEVLSSLGQVLKDSNFAGLGAKIGKLMEQVTYMQFLELMTGHHYAKIPANALEPAITLLKQSITWFSVLCNVFEELSKFDYQQHPERYNLRDLSDWARGDGPPGLQITEKTAPLFFEMLHIDVGELGNFQLSEARMNEINSVIHFTLAEKPKVDVTPDGVLLATGPFVRLSQLCELYQKKKETINAINVFASGTIFIDTDFSAPGRNFVLAAPKISVTHEITINLDGKNGEDKIGGASDGKGESPGESGAPGGDGQHAGHFFATAHESAQLGMLRISANGGDGGRGQDGGKGGNGSKGWDPELPSNRHDHKPIGKENVDWILLEHKTESGGAGGSYVVTHDYLYRLLGRKATDGQRGGNGGAGGLPGAKGEIRFAILGDSQGPGVPERKNSNGHPGVDGKGGSGGAKAQHGSDWKVRYSVTYQGSLDDGRWEHVSTISPPDQYSKDGQPGKSGRKTKDKKVKDFPMSTLATHLNRFKAYSLRVASACPARRGTLESFLGLISACWSIYDLYDISAYLNEMSILESEFWSLHKLLDLKPYYASILRRITTLPQEKPELVTERVDKLLLSAIYAACLSKICSLGLDHQKEERLIVHLKSYMESTIGRVAELETMDKSLAIKTFQKSYRSGIESKITKAKELIEQKVNPEIETLLRSLDVKLDALVNEVRKRRETAVTDRDKLIADEKQMQTAMLIKGALNILKLGAMVASFAGPMGTALGDVATSGATISEQFVIEPNVKGRDKILVPPGVTDAITGLGNLLNVVRAKKFESVEEQLKAVEKELAKKPKDLDTLGKIIGEIREKFKNEKDKTIAENDLDGAAVQKANLEDIEKELHKALNEKKDSLEAEIKKGENDKKEVLKIVDKINKGVKLISGFMDTYNTYKEDQDKLEIIRDSLTVADTNILALKDYERDIHATMFPLVRNMRENVNAVTDSLSGLKSQVALDVSKWETQKMLTGVQTKLTEALKGYKAQAGVTACFNQLTEALNLLVNIYDRLEHFQDQQRLGDYIANIGAPQDNSNHLAGTPFENEFASLHLTIQSNLVLLEYENAMYAFKQWIFPFAKSYYEKYALPKNLKPVRDTESLHALVVAASDKLKSAQNSILGFRNTITHRDDFLYSGTFTSEVKTGGPFFAWDYADYKDELDSLFSGEKITLLADIENVPPGIKDRQSIKFKNVWLKFSLRGVRISPKVKSELDDLMEYFFVELAHGGTCYYDFQDEIYVVEGNPVDLGYSMEKDQKGEPLSQSEIREKLSLSGELLLSPYAQWTLRLSIGNENKWDSDENDEGLHSPFFSLQEFIKNYGQYLVMELVGTGTYIYDKQNRLANEPSVSDYYQIRGKK